VEEGSTRGPLRTLLRLAAARRTLIDARAPSCAEGPAPTHQPSLSALSSSTPTRPPPPHPHPVPTPLSPTPHPTPSTRLPRLPRQSVETKSSMALRVVPTVWLALANQAHGLTAQPPKSLANFMCGQAPLGMELAPGAGPRRIFAPSRAPSLRHT
jgi:hypothetical protein